jgi:general L-amino acid transport system permease protein
LSWSYSFLKEAAGFPISESIIPYDASYSFARAFIVGLLNTLKVALVGVVLATLLGIIAAIARLSTNWLVSRIASVYIEIIRNVPLLVQLFFWYFGFFQRLPSVADALTLPGPIYVSQRGLYMVWVKPTPIPWRQPSLCWLCCLLWAGSWWATALWSPMSRCWASSISMEDCGSRPSLPAYWSAW